MKIRKQNSKRTANPGVEVLMDSGEYTGTAQQDLEVMAAVKNSKVSSVAAQNGITVKPWNSGIRHGISAGTFKAFLAS